jgi:hypothetical protein
MQRRRQTVVLPGRLGDGLGPWDYPLTRKDGSHVTPCDVYAIYNGLVRHYGGKKPPYEHFACLVFADADRLDMVPKDVLDKYKDRIDIGVLAEGGVAAATAAHVVSTAAATKASAAADVIANSIRSMTMSSEPELQSKREWASPNPDAREPVTPVRAAVDEEAAVAPPALEPVPAPAPVVDTVVAEKGPKPAPVQKITTDPSMSFQWMRRAQLRMYEALFKGTLLAFSTASRANFLYASSDSHIVVSPNSLVSICSALAMPLAPFEKELINFIKEDVDGKVVYPGSDKKNHFPLTYKVKKVMSVELSRFSRAWKIYRKNGGALAWPDGVDHIPSTGDVDPERLTGTTEPQEFAPLFRAINGEAPADAGAHFHFDVSLQRFVAD